MAKIRSSWDEARVAGCCVKENHVREARDRHKGWFAEFVGTAVSVRTPRGRVVFTRTMNEVVSSASISCNTHVAVETVSGSSYVLDMDTGVILEAHCVPAAKATDTSSLVPFGVAA